MDLAKGNAQFVAGSWAGHLLWRGLCNHSKSTIIVWPEQAHNEHRALVPPPWKASQAAALCGHRGMASMAWTTGVPCTPQSTGTAPSEAAFPPRPCVISQLCADHLP